MKNEITFSASFDRIALAITTVFILILLSVAGIMLINGIKALNQSKAVGVFVLALSGLDLGILLLVALYAPMKYGVSSMGITVYRMGPNVTIPIKDISGIRVLPGKLLFNDAIRVFASGGAFGYYGKWSCKNFGKFDSYATRIDQIVVIDRKSGDPIALSPDDSSGFTETVNDLLK